MKPLSLYMKTMNLYPILQLSYIGFICQLLLKFWRFHRKRSSERLGLSFFAWNFEREEINPSLFYHSKNKKT